MTPYEYLYRSRPQFVAELLQFVSVCNIEYCKLLIFRMLRDAGMVKIDMNYSDGIPVVRGVCPSGKTGPRVQLLGYFDDATMNNSTMRDASSGAELKGDYITGRKASACRAGMVALIKAVKCCCATSKRLPIDIECRFTVKPIAQCYQSSARMSQPITLESIGFIRFFDGNAPASTKPVFTENHLDTFRNGIHVFSWLHAIDRCIGLLATGGLAETGQRCGCQKTVMY